jgi:predicted phage-related endonuclease
MSIDVRQPKNREEWLALRRQDVTASAVGALLGVHPYLTYFELYMEKSGRLPPDPDDLIDQNGAMLRGQLLESVGIEAIHRQHPEWTVEPNIIGKGGRYYRDPDFFIGATPDALVNCPERGTGIIQIKSVEPSIFRKTWMQDGDEPMPPAWIMAQVIVEAVMTGVQWAAVVPVRVGHSIDVDLIEIPIDMDVYARIKKEAAEFWMRIADMRPPQPDYRRDGKLLAQLLGPDDGTSISLAGDNEFCEAVAMRTALKERMKETEEDLKFYETLIKDRMGSASIATTASYIVTNKTQHRKAYAVAANSFRVLRTKEL